MTLRDHLAQHGRTFPDGASADAIELAELVWDWATEAATERVGVVYEACAMLRDLNPLHSSLVVSALAEGDVETVRDLIGRYRPRVDKARAERAMAESDAQRRAALLLESVGEGEIRERLAQMEREGERLHRVRASLTPGRHDLARKAAISTELDQLAKNRALYRRALDFAAE